MASSSAPQRQSFLIGSAALVVWGEVDSIQIDESALNDWWTNEHLPERLSIPGFMRARRYYARDDQTNRTKYLTFYEVSKLETLTSQPYMDKLNDPTQSTEKHLPTLATMHRSACKLVHSEVRQDLSPCRTGLGATMAMFVLSLPPGDETSNTLTELLSKAFSVMQQTNKNVMGLNILGEDLAATEPGSSTQSYLNTKLKPTDRSELVKWVILFEFSTTASQPLGGVEKVLKPVVDELSLAYGQLGELTSDIFEFMCSVRAS